MSPLAESAAVFAGAKVLAWGAATAGASAWLAVDVIHAMTVSPEVLANRVTIIGGAVLGLFVTGLAMWRDHLKKLQEQNKGTLAEMVEHLARRNEVLEENDRKQDQTNSEQARLIAAQNFEMGQLRATIAEKDDTTRILSMAVLIAKGMLHPSAIVFPGYPPAAAPVAPTPPPAAAETEAAR